MRGTNLAGSAAIALLLHSTIANGQTVPASPLTDAPACFEVAYNSKNTQAMAGCFADSVTVVLVTSDSSRTMVWTRADIVRTYGRIFSGMPKARQSTLGTFNEGIYVAVHERLDEIGPGVTAQGLTVYRLRDGKIDGLWTFSGP